MISEEDPLQCSTYGATLFSSANTRRYRRTPKLTADVYSNIPGCAHQTGAGQSCHLQRMSSQGV